MKKIFIIIFFFSLPIFLFSQSKIIKSAENIETDFDKGPPLPCVHPDVQASNFTATATSSSTIDLTWTRGNGDNVLISVHEAAAVDSDPVSGTSYTADNSAPFSGSEIGTGNFVVYIGNGTSASITGLNSSTTYHFAIYEYYTTDICFLTPGAVANAATPAAAPVISNVSPNNFFADKGAQLTITGFDLGGATVDIAGVAGSIVSNNGSTIVVNFPAGLYTNNTLTVATGVNPNATSTVTVNKRNVIPVGGGTDFHTTIQSALDGLFAWFGTSAFTTNTAGYLAGTKTIDVYAGTYTEVVTPNVGLNPVAGNTLIIQNHAGEAPVINATGNSYAFYIGAIDYVQITGFTAYSSTNELIYTEGNNNIISLNKCYGSTAGSGIVLNNALSTTVINNLVYNNYNFGIRLIASNNAILNNNTVANNGHETKAPPLPGVYIPAQIYVESGTGVEVENNILYAKTGTNIYTLLTESGITVNSDYNTYYKNGNNNLVYYNGALYSNLAAWNGNGAGTHELESDPLFVNAGTDFHIQSTFGSYPYPNQWPPEAAASLWNNDASDSPALDAGNPADPFVNEPVSGGRINQGAYGNTAQASKSVACIYPSTQATNFSATPDVNSIAINWTRGNGDFVIILAHEGVAVNANPTDGTTYTANAAFGSGSEIGTGNFVVYIGALTTETVTALNSSTSYHFAIYEFSDANKCYLIPGLTGNAATIAASPTISNVSPNNFFADKGAQLTITGTYLTGATVDIAGVAGSIVSNNGSTIVVNFPAGLYTNNTLTVATGVNPNATSTVTVNKRNVIPVGGGTDFHTTIQSALDGLFAWFGTSAFTTNTAGYLAGTKTIDVYAGTYTEVVTPNVGLNPVAGNTLIIQNHAGEAPVINATGNNYGIYIGALNYVQTTGLTIRNANVDLIYTEGDNNIINFNKCYGSTGGTGIMLNNANTAVLNNNLIYNNNKFGVRITNSNTVTIKNNTLANNGTEAKGPPLPGVYTPAQIYIESGTATIVENNIFYALSGTNVFTLMTETGVTVTSDYNTYFKNGNTNLVYYQEVVYADLTAWSGNGAGTHELESDPLFVNAGTDFHIQSANDSYHGGEWPPVTASTGTWTTDATTSPALDTGNPADAYANEPVSGGRINQGAYGNTVQASKSAGLYWDGSTSTDWQDATNWAPQQIPTATDDIIIPDGCPNYPVVDDGLTTAVCNNMSIAANASVTIAPNGQMTVSGNITNSAGAVGFTVKSDAAGDGSLIANNAVIATIERFVTGNQWHLMYPALSAIPSTTYTTEGTNNNYNFYSYNEPNEDYWNATTMYETSGWVSEFGAAAIRTDKGYLFNRYNYPDKTFVQTGGNIDVANKTYNVSYTVSTVPIANGVTEARKYFDGWNLAGNPYTCAVDWDAVTYNGIETGVYYYDGTNYQYYITGGGSAPYNIGITANGGSRYIPSGQGFMVKVANVATPASPGDNINTTFTIPNTARVHNDQAYYKAETTSIPNLLRIQIEKDGFTDESVIRSIPSEFAEVSDEHDAAFDAYKMYSWDKTKPQIFTLNSSQTTNFAINTFGEFDNTKIIPVGIYIGEENNYTIRCTENSFDTCNVYLHDIFKDKLTKLENDASYTFSSLNGIDKNRFEIVFEKSGNKPISDIDINLFPNPNNGNFFITVNLLTINFNIEIKTALGQTVFKNLYINGGTNEINLNKFPSGVYFVDIKLENGKVITKKMVIE